jgi:uncharacterized membrane protein YdjX (TVP38/TMEM64 family)
MDQTVREDQKVPLEDLSGLTKKRRFGYATTALKILLIIVLVVTARLVMRRYLDQHELRQYVQLLGIVAPLAFIGLSALVVLIFIPPILLIGVGALSFGSTLGASYSLLGITIGSGLAFLVGKHFLTGMPVRLREGRLKRRLRWVDDLIARNAFITVIGLRLAFYGNAALNYLVGSTAITTGDFLLGTLIGLVPRTVILSVIFEAVETSDSIGHLLKSQHLFLFLAPPVIRVTGMLILGAVGKQFFKVRRSV